MRKLRFYLFVILSIFLFLFIGFNIRVNADVGPKPSVNIKITGLEGEKYTATLISQKQEDLICMKTGLKMVTPSINHIIE